MPSSKPHKWTDFELNTALALICKHEHLNGAASFASSLNQALNGNGSFDRDISIFDVAVLLRNLEKRKKAVLAFIERQPAPHVLTRAKKLVFRRSLDFDGTLLEWNTERKHKFAEEREGELFVEKMRTGSGEWIKTGESKMAAGGQGVQNLGGPFRNPESTYLGQAVERRSAIIPPSDGNMRRTSDLSDNTYEQNGSRHSLTFRGQKVPDTQGAQRFIMPPPPVPPNMTGAAEFSHPRPTPPQMATAALHNLTSKSTPTGWSREIHEDVEKSMRRHGEAFSSWGQPTEAASAGKKGGWP